MACNKLTNQKGLITILPNKSKRWITYCNTATERNVQFASGFCKLMYLIINTSAVFIKLFSHCRGRERKYSMAKSCIYNRNTTPEFHQMHKGGCVCWGPELRPQEWESSCSSTKWSKHKSWPAKHEPTRQNGRQVKRNMNCFCQGSVSATGCFAVWEVWKHHLIHHTHTHTQRGTVSPCQCLGPGRGH